MKKYEAILLVRSIANDAAIAIRLNRSEKDGSFLRGWQQGSIQAAKRLARAAGLVRRWQ